MAKDWDDMSTEEKLEALRKDVHRLFNVANDFLRRFRTLGSGLSEAEARLKEVARDVNELRDKPSS